MGHRDVPQRELPALLAELKDQGVTNIQRSPAQFDGMVQVRWEDAPLEQQKHQALLKGWKQLIGISFIVAFLIAAAIVLFSL